MDLQLCRLEWCSIAQGCFIWNPAQLCPEGSPHGAQGQWHKWIPSPSQIKQWKCSGKICPSGEEKRRLLWREWETEKLHRGPIRLTEPHTCGQAGCKIASKWGRTGPQRHWLSWTNGTAQQGFSNWALGAPLLIWSVSCWLPLRMSGKAELGQQHLSWTQIRL